MRDLVRKGLEGKILAADEMRQVLRGYLQDQINNEQMAGLLIAMRLRGESAEEISGLAQELLAHSVKVTPKRRDLIDTCGTGGDNSGTFNISTTVAFVVAAAGLGVAKHGNRSISSLSGSADVLEKLGVLIEQSAEQASHSIDQNGFAFLFAPLFHPAMKKIGPLRKSLGVRTVFNILGPLLNPASVRKQVIGVFDLKLMAPMIQAAKQMGSERVLIVSADDGLDEISLSTKTYATFLNHGSIDTFTIAPEGYGFKLAPREALKGGDSSENALILQSILNGLERGPKRDIVLLNAGAALWVAGKTSDTREGIRLAEHLIDSGKALAALNCVRSKADI